MSHFIYKGMGFFIIGYLGLVYLPFYYLITLAYVTSCVLKSLWGHGIGCCLQQPLLGQVLIFGYHHASSFGRRLFDVRTRFNCGFGWLGLHIWWWMIWDYPIFRSAIHLCHTRAYFPFRLRFLDLHGVTWSSPLTRCMTSW